jgi:putative ABC transport system permease protein
MTRAERCYRLFLTCLPRAFRAEAEAELMETFRQGYARISTQSVVTRTAFWVRLGVDLVVTSWAERRALRYASRHAAAFASPPSRKDLMDRLQQFRYAIRTLVKNRGFATTAVVTLSLGIGAAVAIFSVVNAVLLEPLPYKDPSRLVIVWQELRARGVPEFPFPVGDIPDLRQKGTLLESVATIQTGRNTLAAADGQFETVRTAFVTSNLFDLLGVGVVRGRVFEEADGTPLPPPPPPPQPPPANAPGAPAAGQGAAPAPSPPPVVSAILSHDYWQRRFGGDPAIVGQLVPFGGGNARAQVVGIAEPDAQLLFAPRHNIERTPDIWIASRLDFATGSRTTGAVRVVARMKPGVTVPQAQGQMDALAKELRDTYPVKKNAGVHINVVSMHQTLVSDVRVSILALMGAVTFVLLIACANVANLMMTQSMRRERELAVRAALGARRGVLIGQLLTESVVLAGVSAAIALGLARLGIVVLQQMGPANLPRLQTVAIDLRVLLFATAAALVSAVIFGLAPALRASRFQLVEVLRHSGRSAGLGAGRLRSGLVVAEVALTFVLLIGAGLMFRSLVQLQRVEPGYDPRGLLTFAIQNLQSNSPQARIDVTRRLRESLGALPGVQGVSAASPLPLDGSSANMPWGIEGTDPAQFQQAAVHSVMPGYFETMRTPVRAGRAFTDDDRVPGTQRIMVDERLAARAYPGQPAVGRPLLLRVSGQNPQPFEIIGVVAHQRHTSLAQDGREALFFVDAAGGFAGRWVVRTAGDPVGLTDAVRAAVKEIDNRAVLAEIKPMSAYVDSAQAPTRFALALTGVFAVIAAVLAAVGLYGVLATLVRQRTAEIGVRLAFGAERASIFRLVVGRGLILAGVGVGIGAAGALVVTRGIQTMLVGVQPSDPATFATIAVLFLLVAVAACGIPAFRASRLDPTVALRSE